MITIITGTPGAGKTLYTVKMIFEQLLPQGRPVYHNINGLEDCEGLTHIGFEGPHKWQEYPDGSIFVFDEIQRQWPSERPTTKVPPEVVALDTHRHRGMDFYLITQAPMGLDSRVRRLIEEHHHLNRRNGIKGSIINKWEGCNDDPRPRFGHDNAEKHVFKFPKKYFGMYKSASLHTDKFRIPWKLARWIGILAAVAGFAGFKLWTTFGPSSEIGQKIAEASAPTESVEAEAKPQMCWPIVSESPYRVRIGKEIRTVDTSVLVEPFVIQYRDNVEAICTKG